MTSHLLACLIVQNNHPTIIGACPVAHECVSLLCCSAAHTEHDSEKNTSSNDVKSSEVQQGDLIPTIISAATCHNVHIRLPEG